MHFCVKSSRPHGEVRSGMLTAGPRARAFRDRAGFPFHEAPVVAGAGSFTRLGRSTQ